jgi:LysM repeat protein
MRLVFSKRIFQRMMLTAIIASLVLVVSVVSAQDSTEQVYTIQSGDTLQAIAQRFDVPLDAILVRNAIIDPNRIRRGQQIIIPANSITLPNTHTVQAGERLTDIATRYNTTVEALRQANNLTTNTIVVGEVLNLPAMGGAVNYPFNYTVDIGETLHDIATRYGITWQLLAAYNNIANPNYIQAGTTIIIPPPGTTIPTPTPAPVVVNPAPVNVVQPVATQAPAPTYVVQTGDVPELIAQRFGVTTESLVAYNNITDTRALRAGDVLQIPPTGGALLPATSNVATVPVATGNFYTVRAGDTLFAIAAANGVNVYTLAQTNGILNLNSIYTGQILTIPR